MCHSHEQTGKQKPALHPAVMSFGVSSPPGVCPSALVDTSGFRKLLGTSSRTSGFLLVAVCSSESEDSSVLSSPPETQHPTFVAAVPVQLLMKFYLSHCHYSDQGKEGHSRQSVMVCGGNGIAA